MREIADAGRDGDGGFTFAIPVRPEWAPALATITLAEPEGSVTLTSNDPAAPAAALVLESATGRIRAILPDPPGPATAAADAVEAGSRPEILFSRGIPDAAAWRR